MRLLSIAATVAVLILGVQATAAENQPYVEGRLGYTIPQDTDFSGTFQGAAATGEIVWKDGTSFGGEFGVSNLNGTGFRLSVSVLSTELEFDQLCGNVCINATGGVDAMLYQAHAYYDLSVDDALQPYFGIGFGMVDLDNDSTEGIASATVGFNYNFSENLYLGLRADYIYADTGATTNFGGGTVLTEDDTTVWAFGAVLGFRF